MYLSEKLEELIFKYDGNYDENFESEAFRILGETVEEDQGSIYDKVEKLKATWNVVTNRHANLPVDLIDKFLKSCFGIESDGDKIPGPIKSIDLRVKKLNESAKIPTKAHPTDAGFDLYANSVKFDFLHGIVSYGLGISLEIPENHVGLLFPRSSIYKTALLLRNSVGVVDAGYRGEVCAKFKVTLLGLILYLIGKLIKKDLSNSIYKVGDKCCQLIVIRYPDVILSVVTELNKTDRGSGGFGSSGR